MNKCIKTLIILAYNIDKITFKFGIIAVVDFKFSIQTYLSPKDFSRANGFMNNVGMVLFYTYFFDWIFCASFIAWRTFLRTVRKDTGSRLGSNISSVLRSS